ncbi:hypothetical protein [uncultured Shewanella sp.]|uniref:hypothetical protein n=1 Tax=uncultured Shewanella sp. TaxID=173975 RepID=UPI002608B956|nr:hypothetical protein [uncultured Shewanella sp.]
MSLSHKFLFVPVSSSEGMGEYMRSLTIANEVKQRWPDANIQFIISRQAPYAFTCPFPVALLNDTPTKNIKAVNDFISFFTPDFVFFDASGRRSQLAHANKLGAKVIFISQHKRKRSKGMKLLRARVTDNHWVVQPEFIIGTVSPLDRLKLKFINKPEPTVIGSVFANPVAHRQSELLKRLSLVANNFILFNAGSGGHQNRQGHCIEEFAMAAARIYQKTKIPCVVIFGPSYPKAMSEFEGVINIKELIHVDFMDLLDASKAAVLSGGDTLLQAIALRKPTVSAAVAKDQNYRIRLCQERGLTVWSSVTANEITSRLLTLIQPESAQQLYIALTQYESTNGLDVAMEVITDLMSEQSK